MNELRREKQKLVEKIMDQYRVLEPGMSAAKQPKSVRFKGRFEKLNVHNFPPATDDVCVGQDVLDVQSML